MVLRERLIQRPLAVSAAAVAVRQQRHTGVGDENGARDVELEVNVMLAVLRLHSRAAAVAVAAALGSPE